MIGLLVRYGTGIWVLNLDQKRERERENEIIEYIIPCGKHRILRTQEWFVAKCAQYNSVALSWKQYICYDHSVKTLHTKSEQPWLCFRYTMMKMFSVLTRELWILITEFRKERMCIITIVNTSFPVCFTVFCKTR